LFEKVSRPVISSRSRLVGPAITAGTTAAIGLTVSTVARSVFGRAIRLVVVRLVVVSVVIVAVVVVAVVVVAVV